MTAFRCILVAALISVSWEAAISRRQCPASSVEIQRYLTPYVQTNNFSGVVLANRAGARVFAKAYGFADREHRIPNTLATRFHIASMSMQFTAAAALRLIDHGKMTLDTPVASIVPEYPDGNHITVRNLLTETSGIADINAQPDYAAVLNRHQTPSSLVEHVWRLPPLREPGSFAGEEHSAYNLLALIIEKEAGVPFAKAVRTLVFEPLGMNDSGIDDDSIGAAKTLAKGYQPAGLYGIEAAAVIHWSAKAGNASAYTTAADELKFVTGLLGGKFLSPDSRELIFQAENRVGYGWFKSNSERFGQPVYSMNGRSPGFSSAVAYLSRDRVLVVALSNLYDSAPSDISLDVAAMLNCQSYQPLTLKTSVDPASLIGMPASFQFAKDFFQPNAVLKLHAEKGEVALDWPGGVRSALIPMGRDHFLDRNFWVSVEIVRDDHGRILELKYDRFTGQRTG